MRKVDPQAIRTEFAAEIDRRLQYFGRASVALSSSNHADADTSLLAEGVFLSASVLFETLVSDLFLAYINRDPAVFLSAKKAAASKSVEDKYGAWLVAQMRFQQPKHVSIADVRAQVDAKGYNVAFPDAAALKTKADSWLAPAYAARFTLSTADASLFDTVKDVRDFLAHRSPSSSTAMNNSLSTVAAPAVNQGLGRGVKKVLSVGAFLRARVAGQQRLVLYLARIKDVASNL